MDFFLIELCDKPADVPVMCEDVTITGLSFKYKDGELSSAVITGTKALVYSISPLVLNTPSKSVCVDKFDKMQHLTDLCIAGLKTVSEYAKDYVNGERLQVDIEFDAEKISKVGQAMRGDTTEKSKKADPNAGKGDEKDQCENLVPTPESEGEPGLPDFEDDGINTTKDVRDDSKDIDIPEIPE